MKGETKGLLAVLGLGALFVGYEVFVRGGVPSGYTPITVAPGGVTTPSPATGLVAFVLPSGASWIAGTRTNGVAPQAALSFPAGLTEPLTQTAVAPASVFFLQWKDASGAVQTSAVAFA